MLPSSPGKCFIAQRGAFSGETFDSYRVTRVAGKSVPSLCFSLFETRACLTCRPRELLTIDERGAGHLGKVDVSILFFGALKDPFFFFGSVSSRTIVSVQFFDRPSIPRHRSRISGTVEKSARLVPLVQGIFGSLTPDKLRFWHTLRSAERKKLSTIER